MRENHDMFGETEGGCALWKRREQVRELLASCAGARALGLSARPEAARRADQ